MTTSSAHCWSLGTRSRADPIQAFDVAGESGSGDVEADLAEFRLYFVYKPNAFEALDAAGRPLRPAMMYNDPRGAAQAEAINAAADNRTTMF